ncbi:aldehyde dehydrogenase family protein [Pseudarthrobacter phenanthrenivorans]|uniref:aldehyde dehydrogenase family protein n=1 Tax=Pseudarthrobacter phenanthrenivorans TaxID=361575 RepID=UPI00344C823D
MVTNRTENYIDGEWVPASGADVSKVVNPATLDVLAEIRLSSLDDVNRAVAAARRAFPSFSRTSLSDRSALLSRILEIYNRRRGDFADALTAEMGAPTTLAHGAQSYLGAAHLSETIEALGRMELEEQRGTTAIVREPAGVAALITPWNWPINQIFTKLASALAAGCTVVLKPSQITPLDALLTAEILEEAGVPKGVFNLVHGKGTEVGRALASHPDVDVVSFTGSTRAGRDISKAAADTIKIVHLELGGKSPNILLDDADFEDAVKRGVDVCFSNAGQSCSVATRMLVPRERLEEAAEIAKKVAESYVVGDPTSPDTTMGPISNPSQWETVQALIQAGIDEGATLVTGGPGKPDGLDKGYFAKPTIFSNVDNKMTIAQEEIFGPVLSIIGYDTEEEAIEIANDSIYGLAGAVQSQDIERARRVAARIHAGHVYINNQTDSYAAAPFGGFKQSGNGYEHGEWGIHGFQVVKSILGAY